LASSHRRRRRRVPPGRYCTFISSDENRFENDYLLPAVTGHCPCRLVCVVFGLHREISSRSDEINKEIKAYGHARSLTPQFKSLSVENANRCSDMYAPNPLASRGIICSDLNRPFEYSGVFVLNFERPL